MQPLAIPRAAIRTATLRIAWGIIIATDRPVLHKGAVTQKVLPLRSDAARQLTEKFARLLALGSAMPRSTSPN